MAIAFRAIGAAKNNTGTGNMASIALPTGHVLNDILVCFVSAADNVVCTMSAGWTRKIGTNSSTNCRQEIWWKRDNGAEAAPTITHASGNSAQATIAAWSGVDSGLSDPFRDAQAQAQVAPGTSVCTAPALTGVVSGDMRIFCGSFGTTSDTGGGTTANWSAVTSFTERLDSANGAGTGAASTAVDDLLASGSAASITSTIGWTGSTAHPNNVGAQLALSSAVGGAAFIAAPNRAVLQAVNRASSF